MNDHLHVYDPEVIPWVMHPTVSGLELRIFENLASQVGYDAVLVRVAPNGVIDWHFHAVAAETIYVVEGRGLIYGAANESEQSEAMGIALKQGDVASIRVGWRHKVQNLDSRPLSLFAMHSPATL